MLPTFAFSKFVVVNNKKYYVGINYNQNESFKQYLKLGVFQRLFWFL